MNKQFLRFTFFLLIYLTLSLTATAQVVDIPDSNLRAEIEKTLGKNVRCYHHRSGYGEFDPS